MNRLFAWLIAAVALAGFCWLFPLFHLVPLDRVTKEKAAATFNATRFAEKFWDERLLKSLDHAVSADVLLPAIQSNAAEAKKKYSRTLGVSESYTYFVTGKGRVLSVTDDEIRIGVTAGATAPEIVLQTGMLFGNAVRDGTGLLDVNHYPNSQDFNDISAALNRLIEARVLPDLRRQAKAGATVHFTGCAEVVDESSDLKPLRVLPIRTEME